MISFNLLARFFLFFSQSWFLIPCVVGGLLLRRNLFRHAVYLLLFTLIFNPFLKAFFHVPLLSHLGKTGFAFPSGHMQASVVFYGWLFLRTPTLLARLALIGLMAGIGWGLVQCHFHTWPDVIAAAGFGGLTLLIYDRIFYSMSFFKKNPSFIGIFLLPLVIFMMLSLYKSKIPESVWGACVLFCVFTAASLFSRKKL